MLLPELQSLAASLQIPGTARMRKGELIAAIQLAQGAGRAPQRACVRGSGKQCRVAADARSSHPRSMAPGRGRTPPAESNGASV